MGSPHRSFVRSFTRAGDGIEGSWRDLILVIIESSKRFLRSSIINKISHSGKRPHSNCSKAGKQYGFLAISSQRDYKPAETYEIFLC